MKTKILLLAMVLFLTSCEVIIEPVIDDRDRLVGSYRVEEYSQTFNDYGKFTIRIRKAPGYNSDVIVENFYNANLNVRAEVINDKIYISKQFIDGYEIEGVGTVYYDEIRFSYRVRDTYYYKPTDFCEATAWEY